VNVVALIVGGCLAVVASLALANVASVQARAVERSAGALPGEAAVPAGGTAATAWPEP
jgi:hypothetical protein